MKSLIINADDFGLTEGVTHGIVTAIEQGVVTSTTAMICTSGAIEHLQIWAPRIQGKIGAHLQLTDGKPISEPDDIPSLINQEGNFPYTRRDLGRLQRNEILHEWRAQLHALQAVGIEPTHLDTHHHVFLHPQVLPAYCILAREFRLPVRTTDVQLTRLFRSFGIPCADYGVTAWHGDNATPDSLINLVQQTFDCHPDAQTIELMCHPGYVDDALLYKSKYVASRQAQLDTLYSSEVALYLQKLGIQLVGMLR